MLILAQFLAQNGRRFSGSDKLRFQGFRNSSGFIEKDAFVRAFRFQPCDRIFYKPLEARG